MQGYAHHPHVVALQRLKTVCDLGRLFTGTTLYGLCMYVVFSAQPRTLGKVSGSASAAVLGSLLEFWNEPKVSSLFRTSRTPDYYKWKTGRQR